MIMQDKLEEDENEATLSLSERAHLNARALYNVGAGLFWGIVALIILTSVAMVAWYLLRAELAKYGEVGEAELGFTPYDTSEYPTELLNVIVEQQGTIFSLLVLILIVLAGILGWLLLRGLRAYGRLEEWDKDYLDEAYILNFETTLPKGETTGQKILNQARSIFPEIRTLKKKKGKSEEEIISESLNCTVDSYILDVALETKEGYFIVKDFKDKVVTLEELKQLIKIIGKIKDGNIFRIICVAKEYDKSLLQQESLERQITKELKTEYAIDLLVEQKATYSVLWIT